MGGRPPLDIGAYGDIYTREIAPGRWMARAQVRDADGVTRPVKRHGTTKSQAVTRLRKALAERAGQALGGQITGAIRLDKLAELWFAEQERLAAEGQKEMSTVGQYRDHYRRHITKGLGQVLVAELGEVWRIHNFLTAMPSKSTAVMCRKVLSGMLGWAVIHRALRANPVRDTGRITGAPKRPARALEAEQVRTWLRTLDEDEQSKEWHLPDLSRFLLATGVRIGEALALSWDEVDLKSGTVDIAHKMVYVKGLGVQRLPSTKAHSERLLDIPDWAVSMLRIRRLATGGSGPLFPHPKSGKYCDHRDMGKRIRAIRDKAGYPWLTSHSLGRKTVATLLDDGGATAREIADLLGHARPSMTQDVYMGRKRKTQRQAALLGESLGEVVRLAGTS